MSTPFFSIIIPVYNGQNVIGRALDSIYSQGLSDDLFEVICVDDCSPTIETYEILVNYTYNGIHPSNLKVLRHEVNKRQGGARNTAFAYAKGEWILYLDQDDCFVDSSLCGLAASLMDNAICDIVMFDYCLVNTALGDTIKYNHVYSNQGFISTLISGRDFLLKYPIPWTPWCYAYKKEFLKDNGILFEENVRFEDVDYVLKSTFNAGKIIFIPIDVYQHVDSGDNTSFVGNNKALIEDLFKISIRMKNVSEEMMPIDQEAANAAMKHHIYHYHDLLVRYLWRLRYNDIVRLLTKYPPYEKSGDRLINFVIKHSRMYAVFTQFVRPILLVAVWTRNKIRVE